MNTITIIGRPNTGKSTLFNMLVGKRLAITHSQAGVTRDSKRVAMEYNGHEFTIIDTGGITEDGIFAKEIRNESYSTLAHSDLILLLVSVEEVTAEDEELMQFVRMQTLPYLLVVNKVDNESREWAANEFYSYGLGEPIMVSALHRSNLDYLWDKIAETLQLDFSIPAIGSEYDDEVIADVVDNYKAVDTTNNAEVSEAVAFDELDDAQTASNAHITSEDDDPSELPPLRLLIMGKPNTGKSSLLNTLLGKNRAIVSEIPGTTRDIVEEEIEYKGEKFIAVDSAGIRKKNKIYDDVEYYASHRAISAIEESDVILLMVDVIEGLSEQDKKLASIIVRKGKGLVIALNKWDLLTITQNRLVAEKDRISYLVPQLHFVPVTPISAKNNTGLDTAMQLIKDVYTQLHRKINTSILNRDVQKWVEKNPPALVSRKRGKLKFAAQSSVNPIVFQARVNNPNLFSESYKQYIVNNIRSKYHIRNVPIRLDFVYNA